MLDQAETIFSDLVDEVTHIMMETDGTDHAAPKYLLPWLEEDAENAIKALHLDSETEERYLQKINNLLGRYSDNPPVEIW